MNYQDTSSLTGTDARSDSDVIPAGSQAPAVGNTITGAGTVSGEAGADVVGTAPGHVIAIQGAGGADSATAGESMQVSGRYGVLNMEADGSYRYVRNGDTPDGVRDVFTYTLADAGNARDTATLTIDIGREPVVVQANAQQVVVGPDGVVTLPAGVTLADVHVVGRNLVIDMPDGTQMVIVDGAVFVPQLVLGGVEVPSANLAALLIDNEPVPAAGNPQSSGGNFGLPPGPLDPGVPLGDLIPPVDMGYQPPDFEDVGGILDREPEAGAVAAQLDDDAKAGGNAGGNGDDADNVNTSGLLPGSGGDGALTFDLLNGGAPTGFTYVDGPNGSILVQQLQDGNPTPVTVLTITVDPATGAYTVTQNAAIRHADGNAENNAIFTISYTVTDEDGDTAIGTLTIDVDDDTPTVSVTAGSDANVILTTHDAATIGANQESVSTTANFSGVFSGTSVSPGADGAGSGTTSGYALSTTGGASGLTQGGVAINLYSVGGVIIGSTATSAAGITAGNTVFSVSVTNTGIVTLTQFSQIDHTNTDPSPTGSPFTDHIISLADGSITLTRTESVTDRDGDTVTGSASVGIGANLRFVDDGPTISIADRNEPSLTVDETDLSANASASFAANFTAAFGADGPAASGSITYALGINAGSTGLIDVATGQAIVLVVNGGVVEGHVGSADGAIAFTVSVDAAGTVTLDQVRALSHPDATDADDSVTLDSDNLITLTGTAHDFDGDTASVTLNIGQNLNFEDDGPSIDITLSAAAEPTLITQDSETDGDPTAQDSASASFAGNFSIASSGGADGAASVSTIYALGVSSQGQNSGLTSSGAAIYLYNIGGVVVGSTSNSEGGVDAGNTIFAVSVVGNGANAGTVTLTQYAQIDHTTADPSPTGSPFIDHVATLTDSFVTLTATSTITDNDGDQATDSQTLNIGANLQFQDDGPDISAVLTGTQIRIDETDGVVAAGGEIDPPGGNLGTVTVAAATLFTVSNVNGSADTPTTYSYGLNLSSQGVDSGLNLSTTNANIYLYNIGGTVYGSTSATEGGVDASNTAFTVSVNPATGAVTLTQFLAVEHPTPGNSYDEDSSGLAAGALNVTITGTDFDGDTDAASVDLGSVIRFEDDGPTVDVTLSTQTPEPSLITQDSQTDGNPTAQDTASASFAGNFSIASSGGADGTASLSTIYALGVSSPGVNSGLTSAGSTIYLYTINGVVVGSTSSTQGGVNGGNTIFDVSVVASGVNAGTVTLTQYAQIDHTTVDPSPTGSPFVDHVATLTDSLVTLTATTTITDNDGDTASDSQVLNIGANLVFQDDGPDISAVLTGNQIRIDETDGVVAAGGEVDPVGGNLGTVTVAAATLFTVSNVNVSADTPTTTAYALTLSSQGVDSGLDVSSNNANIYLYNIGGVVYGSTAATQGTVDTANLTNVAFTVSIDAGTGAITLTQYQAIEHPTPGASHDEDSSAFNADVLNVTVTASDFDGDTDQASVDLGSVIRFEDDGPTATNDTDSVSGGAGPATGNVLTGLEVAVAEDANNTDGNADNVGQDTPGTITFIASNNVPANTDGTYTGGNLVVNGQYGTLTINANGDYSYTRTDLGVGGVSDVFTYTLTDADGDTTTATLTIGIEDAFPAAGTRNVVIDDDDVAGAGGNPGGTDDDAPSNVTGTLPGSGGNGTLTRSFAAVGDQPALPTGFTYGTVDADTIQILQNGNPVLTIQITDPATGAYTVTQNAPIQHPSQDATANDNTENNVDFTFTYRVTDGDGDVANGTLNVSVDDDTPTIDVALSTTAEPNLITQDAETDGTPTTQDTASASFAANFTVTSSDGADGPASPTTTYALGVSSSGVNSGLTSGGSVIYLYNIGGVVVGSTSNTQGGVTAGNTIFDVSVVASGVNAGTVTLTQYSQIDHTTVDPTPGGTPFIDHVASLTDSLVTLTATSTITDTDGDTATDSQVLNIGAQLRFQDDGPDVNAVLTGTQIRIDETDGVTAAGGEVDPVGGNLGTVTMTLASLVTVTQPNVSADSPTTLGYSLVLSSQGVDSGLDVSSNNASIFLYDMGGGVIAGSTSATFAGVNAGNTAFTISISSGTGAVTMTQFLAIEHSNTGSNDEDSLGIAAGALTLRVTATDFDNDTDVANVDLGSVVRFEDDGPTLGVIQNQTASNTPGDPTSIGTLHFAVGSDSPASVTAISANNTGVTSGGFNLVTNVAGNVLTAYQDVNGNGTYEAGTDLTPVYTLTVNPGAGTSGQYVFDLINPLDPNVTETAIGGSSSFGAGPTAQGQILSNVGGTQNLAVVSGYHMTGTFNEANWLATGNAGPAGNFDTAGVNGSTAGWGIDNNNFNGTDEMFVWDFGSQALRDPDGAGPAATNYAPPAGVVLPDISTATFDLIGYTAADDITYVVHYTDGSFDSGHVPSTDMVDGTWKFIADAGKFIADIEMFTSGTGSGKVDLVSVGVQSSNLTETINFNVTITDADGDPVSGGFSVNVATGNTPAPPAAMEAPSTKVASSTLITEQQQAANSNSVLVGAIAGAGLMAASQAAAAHVSDVGALHLDSGVSHMSLMGSTSLQSVDVRGISPMFDSPMIMRDGGEALSSRAGFNQEAATQQSLAGHASAEAPVADQQLPAGNDVPVASQAAEASSFATGDVAMPSLEALAASVGQQGANAQETGDIAQVLAEALAGGGGADIDSLLANVGHGGSAVDALASHGMSNVPAWDMGGFGGFSPAHQAFTMESLVLHQDAVVQQA